MRGRNVALRVLYPVQELDQQVAAPRRVAEVAFFDLRFPLLYLAALTLALQPMSSLAVLLAADTFGWSSQLPGAHTHTIQALLLATTLIQVTGPIWTQLSLRHLARETNEN